MLNPCKAKGRRTTGGYGIGFTTKKIAIGPFFEEFSGGAGRHARIDGAWANNFF